MSTLSFDVSRKEWLERWGHRSLNSLEMAQKAMVWWDKYLKQIKTEEEPLLKQLRTIQTQPEFYQFINNLIQFLVSNKLSPMTVKTYFMFVKSYLRSKGFRIYTEDVKQFIQMPKKIKEAKVAITMEQISLLYEKATPKMKAIISFLVSSGATVGEMLQLRVCDVKGNQVMIRTETTKNRPDRVTYMSDQANQKIQRFLKGKEPKEYIFTKNYIPLISVVGLEKEFARLRKKCGLVEKYRLTNRHHITLHRFRAFCKTMVSMSTTKDFAEGLIGHEGYLPTYFALPEAERLKAYRTAEAKLTIPTQAKR